ncbi:WbqC family protein [Acidianus sp. HS-5]|uniref:WbqC family protein n=1 Tax=Acidianus sp. HS-5 TaxID=2886040 RepID=UPI001F218FCB|nr:WbqC family protein [Acidianus sp. HS-5]BDC17403.1 hypothetical protein HS5_02930 [Acidianus sp. HS-5]
MKKVAIMQPYFFPYIGYWQLIYAADIFIIFDIVQFIWKGWINRNRVLKENGGWKYITIPVKHTRREEKICEVEIVDNLDVLDHVLKNLAYYYKVKKKVPYYDETVFILRKILSNININKIAKINEIIIRRLCEILDCNTEIYVASSMNFDYSNVKAPGDWAFEMTKQIRGDMYINPPGGRTLFDKAKFEAENIDLKFLVPNEIRYQQIDDKFEPWLSIIDVLMFNGVEKTKKLLEEYRLED